MIFHDHLLRLGCQLLVSPGGGKYPKNARETRVVQPQSSSSGNRGFKQCGSKGCNYHQIDSLNLHNITTENRPSQKERLVFQPSIFRCFSCQFQGGYQIQSVAPINYKCLPNKYTWPRSELFHHLRTT